MSKRKSYTAEFKLRIVKYAAENSNRAAERQFGISEKNVRNWRRKEATLREMKKTKKANRGLKARWPELEEKLHKWVHGQQAVDKPPSMAQFRRHAHVVAKEMNIRDFAGGHSWCYRFMERKRLSIKPQTRARKKLPSDFQAKMDHFCAFVENQVIAHDVSSDHIINMDEIPLTFNIPMSRITLDRGRKSVNVVTRRHEKLHLTVALACCGDGTKLPPMVIFKRKIIAKDECPASVVVTTNSNGRMDEDSINFWLAKCYAKRPDGFFKRRKSILVMDSMRSHITPYIQDQIKARNSIPAIIPRGLTKFLQPLVIAVNRSFKAALCRLCETWMADGERSYTTTGRMGHATFKDVVGWIDRAWAEVTTDTILSGFQKAGLIRHGTMSEVDVPLHLPQEAVDLFSSDTEDEEFFSADEKTFTPNIIGRKTKEELKVQGGQRRERKDGERGGRGQRDRGRGRGRPEIIQSHSIFEQGPSEAMVKKRGAYESEREAPSVGPAPIINIKKEKRETEEETKEILRKLERDNFIDDPYLKSEERSCPVQLPLAISGWGFKEEFSDPFPKIEKVEEDIDIMEPTVQVKQEPVEMEIKKAEANFKPPPLPEPENLPDLLDRWSLSKGEELIFIQLPDTLPGQPPTREVRTVKTEVQSEDGQSMLLKSETPEEQVEENTCHLNDLQEGLVGKMLVRKSGRVQLILGHVILDVSLGTPCGFLQELVSVGTQGQMGDMTVLGHIKHKMVCSPDFEALLESRT